MGQESMPQSKNTRDRGVRIASQYAELYPWADREALQLFFRIDLAGEALHAAGSRVHEPALPRTKPWLARVLRALYMAPDHRMSHAGIAKETGVPPANVTYQIDALRDEGYVQRVPHQTDRRITLVELTDQGRTLCETIIPAWTRFMTDIGAAFSEDEKQLLNQLLERLEAIASSYPDQLSDGLPTSAARRPTA
jgi:DNA-binding MarR family transcriptional regulator